MDIVGVSATNGGTIELDGGEGRPEGVKVGGRDADNRSTIVLLGVKMTASETAAAEECTLVPTWWRELLAVTVITASAVTAVALIRWCVGKQ